jgi:prepilin-type N-terminal cleavage/methylation domain-containing protein/prepilin-type processing-associated H-X9-DG protein
LVLKTFAVYFVGLFNNIIIMKKWAFTLIEILVVIAIIGTLTGILMPVLRYARQQSLLMVCSSNLNQLSLALTMYEQNNNTYPFGFNDEPIFSGHLPPGGFVGVAARDSMGWWWFHFLKNIIGNKPKKEKVLWCPARAVQDNLPRPNILCGNYGVNQAICKNTPSLGGDFVGKPLSLSSIRKPSQTLLIMDSGYTLISWKAASEPAGALFGNPLRVSSFYIPGMEINKTRSIEPSSEIDAIDGRHLDKLINIGFADGHLSSIKSDDLFIENNANRSYLWFPR